MTLILKELLTYYHKIPVVIELQTQEMYCARIRMPSEADFMLTNNDQVIFMIMLSLAATLWNCRSKQLVVIPGT